ncbi:hypothetical protein [Actinocatenispora comari]|uniref:Uncharacterized protein n=1 Tax=Actinocatenispora comari TaxID=2807577 RepID=A0A8J4ENK8_9ACTN|nr:hypothetical protein [Actinocatenispora comari]GIL29933.1 hypothetical protein NUM_51870 [Actinocatenispora comari]
MNDETTTEALRRFRERLGYFTERIALGAGDDVDDLPDVIFQEVAYLAQKGPVAYVRYVEGLDALARGGAELRAGLDRELRLILGEGDDR